MAPAVAEARAAASPGDGGSAFARALASGAQKQRDAALAALSRWLASRKEVDETEMLKLWKGLFYAMWHADKPAVQVRPACKGMRRAPLPCLTRAARAPALPQADVAERMAAVLDSSQPEVRVCGVAFKWPGGARCAQRAAERRASRAQVALAYFRGCFTTLRCARPPRRGTARRTHGLSRR